jgi:hypothetical protein
MENLSSDSKLPKDNEVEVGIHFDMSVMTKEQINKLFQAQKLLNEIGITFDTGADGKQRDWEWDWSLKGPVHVSFRRMSKDNKKNRYARDMISKDNFPSSGQGEGLK